MNILKKNQLNKEKKSKKNVMTSSDSDKENEEPIEKPKRAHTQKQIEAFEKACQKMKENAQKRKEDKEIDNEIRKKELEEKVLKKALSIKKKEIKKKAILEEISSDSEGLEIINKIAKKIEKKKKQPKEEQTKFKFI